MGRAPDPGTETQAGRWAGLVILDLSANPLGDAGALCESTTLASFRRLYAKPISGEYAPEGVAVLDRRFTDRVFAHVFHTFYSGTVLDDLERVMAEPRA